MLYVQLDTNWPDHEKIIEAGMDGRGLHATLLCLVGRSKDGTVAISDLLDRGASPDLIGKLTRDRLAIHVENNRLTVPAVHLGGVARPAIPAAVRRAVMERDGATCQECGSKNSPSLDHIVPFSHGGPDTVENLRVLCRPCNSRRGNRV